MNKKIKPGFIFIATLGILSMLPPFGVDMYLPSFLAIAEDLNISPERVQHTLTAFSYGMAFGQLFWDRSAIASDVNRLFCSALLSVQLPP